MITSPPRTLLFDSAGLLHVPDYVWAPDQTFLLACTLNNRVNIMVARFSGKAWVER